MSGRELRLTEEEFDTLRLVVAFADDDLSVTEGRITPGMLGIQRVVHAWIGLADVERLKVAIRERTVEANVPLGARDRSGRQGRAVAGHPDEHEGQDNSGEAQDLPRLDS